MKTNNGKNLQQITRIYLLQINYNCFSLFVSPRFICTRFELIREAQGRLSFYFLDLK